MLYTTLSQVETLHKSRKRIVYCLNAGDYCLNAGEYCLNAENIVECIKFPGQRQGKVKYSH